MLFRMACFRQFLPDEITTNVRFGFRPTQAHMDVMTMPDRISRNVLARGLDTCGVCFHLVTYRGWLSKASGLW